MKYLLSPRNLAVLERFMAARPLLAFDFDGTLAPLTQQRQGASLRPATAALLEKICRLCPCAVISGRSREDVVARLGAAEVRYVVGSHGLDWGDPLEHHAQAVAQARRVLQAVLAHERGVDLEDKGFSLAVHYRQAAHPRRVRAVIAQAAAALVPPMRLVPGKFVVNLVPAAAPHKGAALLKLCALEQVSTAIYVGDDVTDEDVFQLHQPERILAIRVGRSARSAASYYLRNQAQIDRMLEILLALASR